MEIYFADSIAEEKCRNKKEKIVELVHRHIGLASMVEISAAPRRKALCLETATRQIQVDYNLTKKLRD